MASRLFTVDLDLGLNKARRFIFEDFSSAPTGTTGRVIYWTAGDSSANHLKVYNGSAWKTIAYTDDVPSISISLDAATGFNVTGSPAGASGTLTFEWDTVAANSVLAGAVSGSNAIPTFRALVDADIPVEIARVDDVNTSLGDYILLTEKGEPLGVAELDANSDLTIPGGTLILKPDASPGNTPDVFASNTTGSDLRIHADGQIDIDSYGDMSLSTSGSIEISAGFSTQPVIISGAGGEYLNSQATGNQIATVGDISGLSSVYQPLDTDLTNIAALTGTAGLLYTDGASAWSVDTSDYLTSADLSGYLTSETDPVYTASSWYTTTNNSSNWDTAYGWGDHSAAGYLTSITNADGNIDISGSQIDLANTISVGTINAGQASASLFDDTPASITIGTTTDDIQIGSATSTLTVNNDLVVTGDLTVNGDVTTLNTATMNVEDNIFVLNSNVTGTPTANAGLEVERGTYTNASIYWNETANKWYVGTPVDTTDAAIASPIARKYVTTTTGTTHTITHNLNTSDVTVNCWLSGEQVEAAIVVTDANTVTVTTNSSITDLKTVVVG